MNRTGNEDNNTSGWQAGHSGRIQESAGIKPGDEVLLSLEDGEIRIVSTRQAVARAQTLVRRYIPKGRNLSEELIQERQEEAAPV